VEQIPTRSPWEDPMLELGHSVRSPPPEEEGVAETTCDELTITPIPHPPALLGEGRRERNGSEAECRKKGGVGEGVLCYSDLTSDKLISPS